MSLIYTLPDDWYTCMRERLAEVIEKSMVRKSYVGDFPEKADTEWEKTA